MKNAFSFAVWMTLASVIFKLGLFMAKTNLQDSIMYVAFFNLLVISTGTFFGIRQFKIQRKSPQPLKEEIKAGMRVTALYAIFMAVFVYFYYSNIDSEAFSNLIAQRLEAARLAAESGNQNVDLAQIEKISGFIFSPRTHATITLFGFLVAGAIYSLLISFFMKRFPGFK